MIKVSRLPLSGDKISRCINDLWSAFTLMGSKEQVRDFLGDLITHTERKMLAKRLAIARQLLEGNTYEFIMNDLRVTERTITNISNTLARDGSGLRNAHEKLKFLEENYRRKAEKRQNYLERKGRPKLPGEKVLPEALKAGVSSLGKLISKKIKTSSAKKSLSI